MLNIVENLKRAVRNSTLTFLGTAVALFWLIYACAGFDSTREISHSLVLGTSFFIAATWFSSAARAFRKALREPLDGFEMFQIAFFGLCAMLFVQRSWIILTRWLNEPNWMSVSPIGPLVAWLIFVFCGLLLLSPKTVAGAIPAKNKVYLALSAMVGGLIAGITIGVFVIAA